MNFLKCLAVVSSALVMGCSGVNLAGGVQAEKSPPPPEATASQLAGDFPLPPGAKVRPQDTLVMGTGNRWTGRIGMEVAGDAQNAFTYFRDNLPRAGWALNSSSFSKLSVLTFNKADRVATVQIQASTFGGNQVSITVTPAVRPSAP